MVKLVLLLKRKAGLTFDQFRDMYEESHVNMAMEHFGHLLVDYRRNYLPAMAPLSASDVLTSQENSGPDVVTEAHFANEEAFQEFTRLFGGDLNAIFVEDEKRLFDRAASWWGVATVVSSR